MRCHPGEAHFAERRTYATRRSGDAFYNSIGPSARTKRAPQDDKVYFLSFFVLSFEVELSDFFSSFFDSFESFESLLPPSLDEAEDFFA